MPPKCVRKRKRANLRLDPVEPGATETVTSSTGTVNNSNLAVPLTRNDIPQIVQEIVRQLQTNGADAHTPLVLSMY